MAGIVVVFDFDKTIIECDSDSWVINEMGLTQIFNELRPTLPWNSLMDRLMKELHSKGITVEEIAECLKRIPLHPRIMAAIKSAYALGCDLRIVSDANIFYIETILKHHNLMNYFSEINTNPILIDEQGSLRILPYQDFISSSHGCNLCPSNMCKGTVIERIQALKKRFIYLGDGKGDFCPSIKLGDGDHVMPRKNFPLSKLICSNKMLIKAEVHEWNYGEELETILLNIINTISVEENRDFNSTSVIDCKFQTNSSTTYEALHNTLPVPQ